ncbi:TetR/AcrR family transcriptional regulator [Hoeflea ulvae]|uniref:TetR/AcrR family transcriptional regulator n=1 Tax=Hoeflea ulvae TaxID=2983764 RepID=A0ABT3YJW6_9HYPH|nr:TetR/AcrR family transcriptional regulator [Hoeflea ulvae]MCY0096171.1 TetR/AcrR family transcriptional regulator [Hoeflea ulvae]
MLKTKDSYHHGDLRAALLKAGEEVLAESGIDGFSLRAVAKRVGVSHSAPAHHFGDAKGLLDALATEGFRRFLAAMEARQKAETSGDPRQQVLASGLGYLDFAVSSPALFRLMFAADKSHQKSDELTEAAQASFVHLAEGVARLRGVSPFENASAMTDVMAIWSMVHGFSELFISGRLGYDDCRPPADRDAFLVEILDRAIG